jgi:hypothetical protein
LLERKRGPGVGRCHEVSKGQAEVLGPIEQKMTRPTGKGDTSYKNPHPTPKPPEGSVGKRGPEGKKLNFQVIKKLSL